ncbi:MAG: hypothetical protein NC548_26150 [Lachnospiraceae bacterium]|nr:hypothetical protein [Lachnospiraceae bacterium]
MKVRIIENKTHYVIETKKHWWSRWRQFIFTDSAHTSVQIANNILNKSHDTINPNQKPI